jgi:carbonic anhydrase
MSIPAQRPPILARRAPATPVPAVALARPTPSARAANLLTGSALLLAGLLLVLSPPAVRAEDHGGHAAPASAATAPAARPAAKAAEKPADAHADKASGAAQTARPELPRVDTSRAERPVAPEAKAGAGRNIGMDELSRKLTDKVAEVRDRQARTPVLKLTAHSAGPRAEGRSARAAPADPHGAADKLAADAQAHAAHDLHWAYNGEGGPSHWGELKSDFATCAKGQRQSPIDIRGGLKVDLPAIKFDYRPVGFGVVDNGHTIQANLQPGNAIEINGRRYDLLQFHFHRPSEERINGRQYEMVVHLVHKDPEGRLAVIAVLVEQGRSHAVVQSVWNSLPLEKNDELASPVQIDLNQLLPEDRRYYTYMGSLTTPPCTEGVLWLVLKQPASFSPEQIGLFARLYPMNARPIQQAAGRTIKESN